MKTKNSVLCFLANYVWVDCNVPQNLMNEGGEMGPTCKYTCMYPLPVKT